MGNSPRILTEPQTMVPHHYKMVYRRVQCRNCGLIHSYDDVWAMIQPVAGSGFRIVECYQQSDIEYSLPVKVETAPLVTRPFCHICFHPDLLKGKPKPAAQATKPVPPSWVGAGPQAKPKAPKSKPEPKQPRTYTVDDLDID